MKIRATHRYGFRSGEWATIVTTGTQLITDPGMTGAQRREVYVVQFDDGILDTWPVDDPSDPYEFEGAP